MYESIEIESFAHFINILEEDAQFDSKNTLRGITLYRGQNCDLPLLPKIGRYKKPPSVILDIEITLINEFIKRCQPYLGFDPGNDWDFLAHAQHFGLPTRLLDWTENPLIALWFAVTTSNEKNANGVVWIFDVEEDDIVVNLENDPFEIENTKVFDPNHINQRITSQAGWFTVHRLTDSRKKNLIPLEANPDYHDVLIKLIIPSKFFPDFKQKLNKMGINQSTIFQDLDGLCKHLTWRYLH